MLLHQDNNDDRIWFGIVINNKSGNGRAEQICFEKIFPKLTKLNYKYDIVYELKDNIINYDGIIIVGGDGTIFPIIQYLCNNNLDTPLCIIPSGSGNGLCKSILFEKNMEYNIDNACSILDKKNIVFDEKIYANLLEINKNTFCFLSITWGIISDLDYNSEWLRKLGSFRFNIGAVMSLLKKKSYYGILKTLKEDGEWEIIKGDFIYFLASNSSHISHNTYTMPYAKLNDDYIHITYLLEPVSRYELLNILISLESGEHVNKLSYVKTKQFILEPDEGLLMIDGETNNLEKIEVKVSEKKITLF